MMMLLVCVTLLALCGVNGLHILPCEPNHPGPLGCDEYYRNRGNLGGRGSPWQPRSHFDGGFNNRFDMGFQPRLFSAPKNFNDRPRSSKRGSGKRLHLDPYPKGFKSRRRTGSFKKQSFGGSAFNSYHNGLGSTSQFGKRGSVSYPKGLMFLNQRKKGHRGFDPYPKGFGSMRHGGFKDKQVFDKYPKGVRMNINDFYPKRSSKFQQQFYPRHPGFYKPYPKFNRKMSQFRMTKKRSSRGY